MIKKKKDYGKSKKAFDSVMSHYRQLSGIGSISAVNLLAASHGSVNPARPTPLDFKSDVDKVIKKIIPKKCILRFLAVYIWHEGVTPLEQEMLADKILGGVRHSFEQRLGEQFIQRKVFPVQARGYFYCIRKGSPNGNRKKG